MEFLKLVNKRNSCRKYSDKPVPRESLERCLEAARLAPSACNSQPWSFLVVCKSPLKEQVAQAAFEGIHTMNQFANQAQGYILAFREESKPAARMGQMIQGTQYNLIDLGIACEHLVLQAAEEGIGTCWIGWFNEKKVKKVLNIPYQKKLEIIISLGYPLEDLPKEKHRKCLDEIRKYVE